MTRKFNYSDTEAGDREMMLEIKHTLLQNVRTFRQGLDLANAQIRNVDRCQDAWVVEALFRRGIPIDRVHTVEFGENGLEVDDDQPA
jgi:hypothetical protein